MGGQPIFSKRVKDLINLALLSVEECDWHFGSEAIFQRNGTDEFALIKDKISAYINNIERSNINNSTNEDENEVISVYDQSIAESLDPVQALLVKASNTLNERSDKAWKSHFMFEYIQYRNSISGLLLTLDSWLMSELTQNPIVIIRERNLFTKAFRKVDVVASTEWLQIRMNSSHAGPALFDKIKIICGTSHRLRTELCLDMSLTLLSMAVTFSAFIVADSLGKDKCGPNVTEFMARKLYESVDALLCGVFRHRAVVTTSCRKKFNLTFAKHSGANLNRTKMDDIAEFDVSHIEFMGEELKPGNLRRLADKMDPDFNMLSTLLSIRHENIVSYFSYDLICVSDTSEISAIIASLRQCRFFEQAQGDDALSLLDFVRKTRVEMKQMIRYTLQLLDALDYLHSQNVPYILMALQTTSIKVTPDYASVKIFDWLNPFYFSPMLHHKHQILSGENFLYPDVLKRISEMETAGAKTDGIHFIDLIKPNVDVWSLGCVVLDMMSGGDLRHVDKNGIILDKSLSLSAWRDGLTDGGYPLIPSSAPDLVRRICKKCFRRDPLRQYTAKELTRFIQEAQEAGKHVKSIGDEIPPEVHQASATRPYCAVSISVDDMPRTSRDVLFSPEPAKTTKSIDCQLDEGIRSYPRRSSCDAETHQELNETSNRRGHKMHAGADNNRADSQPITKLERGQSVASPDQSVYLTLQDDGDLVLYRKADNLVLWASNTYMQPSDHAIMQPDGDFVLYNKNHEKLWHSRTGCLNGCQDGAFLVLQNDGNLVIYDDRENWLWSTNTGWLSDRERYPCWTFDRTSVRDSRSKICCQCLSFRDPKP